MTYEQWERWAAGLDYLQAVSAIEEMRDCQDALTLHRWPDTYEEIDEVVEHASLAHRIRHLTDRLPKLRETLSHELTARMV